MRRIGILFLFLLFLVGCGTTQTIGEDELRDDQSVTGAGGETRLIWKR